MAYGRIRVPVGRDENGEFVIRQPSGKNDIERFLNGVQLAYNSGFLLQEFPGWFTLPVAVQPEPEKERILVFEFLWNRWFYPLKKGKKSDNYEYQLKKRLEKIAAHFEKCYMDELSEANVQAFFDERDHLGHRTLTDFRNTMKEAFGYAIEKKLIDVNAVNWKRITVGGHRKKSRKAATVKEHMDIIDHLSNLTEPVEQLAVAIPSYTAVRPEELVALRWEDVNFVERRIYICRAIVYPGENKDGKKSGHAVLKCVKTPTSEDWIPIADGLFDILKKHRRDAGWIIHDSNGSYFETYSKWQCVWKNAQKSINLYGLRVCEFRKTIPTVLNALGVDPKSIQRLLRHANAKITFDTYAEVDPDTFIAGCNKIGRDQNVKCE